MSCFIWRHHNPRYIRHPLSEEILCNFGKALKLNFTGFGCMEYFQFIKPQNSLNFSFGAVPFESTTLDIG